MLNELRKQIRKAERQQAKHAKLYYKRFLNFSNKIIKKEESNHDSSTLNLNRNFEDENSSGISAEETLISASSAHHAGWWGEGGAEEGGEAAKGG